MTDTLPGNEVSSQETSTEGTSEETPDEVNTVSSEETPPGPVRYCSLFECQNTLPADAHARRIYCDEHDGRSPERRKVRRQWLKDHGITDGPDMRRAGPQDQPPKVAFEIGTGGGPATSATKAELAAVEARMRQILQFGAALMLIGATEGSARMADVKDIAAGTPALASSVGHLAQYEPWLRKLGAGGEMSDRAQAWLAVAMAAGVMATPILVRHDVIKGSLAELAATIIANGESLPAPAAAE